jgi:hypothetical protein
LAVANIVVSAEKRLTDNVSVLHQNLIPLRVQDGIIAGSVTEKLVNMILIGMQGKTNT